MVSQATESTHESSSFTRMPNEQFIEDQESTIELGSVVHAPDQQAIEDEDPTQELSPFTHVPDRHALQAQESTQETASLTHAPDGQAMEEQESTQEFTFPPHGAQVQDAIYELTASASTDIPDRQVIGGDETTQEFTASTIIHVPDRQVTGDDETTQEFTASTIIHVPERQVIGDDETTQQYTASPHIPDRRAIEGKETTQGTTASTPTHLTGRQAIGHEETTKGLTGSNNNPDIPRATPESTASSSTHISGRHAAEAQETAQQVSVSTSFAANIPDRQVVEADAFTLPPLTITTQESTASTHVPGTQAMEARQEDSQIRRAGSAPRADSIQEIAAAPAPEMRTDSRATDILKKDNQRMASQSELSKDIMTASMTVPSARLTIAYNRRFVADDKYMSKDVIRHPRTASGWDMISVIQCANLADFKISLSYHDRPVKEVFRRLMPAFLTGQLIFQPSSDNCVLKNQSGSEIYVLYLDAPSTCAQESVDSMQCHVLRPGMWRISKRAENPQQGEYHSLVEFLIMPRQFSASVDGESPTSTKRQKLSETSLARKYKDATILIQDLEDGQSARIRGVQDDTADYELQRIRHIASTPSACVFSCRHSKVAGVLAVKVVDYDVESVNQFNSRAAAHLAALVAALKRELSFLEKVKHNHIVSLKAFDGRLLALFLEQLPPSLDRGDTIKLDSLSVKAVLRDISSALDYLEKKGIVHHDIKPHNIAHSPARGAVLLDFGQAAAVTASGIYGGTLAFLPPEFLLHGARGCAGDVWALGLTMLYILGKVSMPRLQLDVRIRDLYRCAPPPEFEQLQETFASRRRRLNLDDEIEELVFRMLDPRAEARVTAQTIVSALEKTLLTA
ncbi:kinase-like protein [Trichoderma novae-zelandiae]